MKKGDIIIIAAALFAAAFLYFSGILSPGEEGGKAVVYVNGQVQQTISLKEDGEYRFEIDGGYNVLEIKDGKADMTEADCRDKICVNHTPIYRENESITCLPHKLVVEIEGGEKNDVDVVVQ